MQCRHNHYPSGLHHTYKNTFSRTICRTLYKMRESPEQGVQFIYAWQVITIVLCCMCIALNIAHTFFKPIVSHCCSKVSPERLHCSLSLVVSHHFFSNLSVSSCQGNAIIQHTFDKYKLNNAYWIVGWLFLLLHNRLMEVPSTCSSLLLI